MDNRRYAVDIMPENIFKSAFKKSFEQKINKSIVFDNGDATFFPGWKDWAGYIGINAASNLSIGIVSICTGAGLVAAAVTPAITIPIALVGVASYTGFAIYRQRKKLKEHIRLSNFFKDRNINDDSKMIANNLHDLYEDNISIFSGASNRKFAATLAKMISHAIMKNKIHHIDDLFNPATLHNLFISISGKIPKETLRIIADKHKCNTRGYISKSAIHCKETNRTYINANSRLEKYGLTSFSTKNEWKQFKKITEKTEYFRLDTTGTVNASHLSMFTNDTTSPLSETSISAANDEKKEQKHSPS